MKKKISILLVLAMAISLFSTSFAFATEVPPIEVRANGYIIDFPDAKPFVDENNRTLIPLRFATEGLGATVTWDNPTQTATISKNGITVDVKIGSDKLTVTENGKSKTVIMDTKAIMKDSRTFVPIRFVAESLGVFVGWSNYYNTVELYQDVLTVGEITRLRSYDHTINEGGRYFEGASDYYATAEINKAFQDSACGFANAHEFMLRHKYPTSFTTNAKLTNKTWKINEDNQGDKYVAEGIALANKELSHDGIQAEFKGDMSCLYQDSFYDGSHYSMRGILKVTLDKNNLKAAKEYLKEFKIPYVDGITEYTRDFEVRVNMQINHSIDVYGYYFLEV